MSNSHDTNDVQTEAEIPIGMERLLGLAAVDERLAEELERNPAELAEECGIVLEPTELTVLTATPASALRRMLDGIRKGLAEPDRRQFIQRAALIATALFGAGVAGAGCKKTTPESGSQSGSTPTDMAPPPKDMTPPPKDMAAKADAGVPPRRRPPYMDQVKRGVSPRRPRPIRSGGTRTGIRPK